MFSWGIDINVPSLVIGALIGTLLSTWHSYYVKRPKLVTTGGGGGGGPGGFHTRFISVQNPPGLLGFRLRETILFGKTIHGQFETGLVVDRDPAHECRAWLYDKETNQPITLLWWQASNGEMTQAVTLKSGESALLMVFARLHDEPLKYFAYQLKNPTTREVDVPRDEVKFDSTREFVINLQHSYGKRRLRISCKVTKGFDGRLSFHSGPRGGGGSF